MVDIVTPIITATFLSALYAIIAIGFTLIFGVGGILNFAHGAFITIGAFTAYFITNSGVFSFLPGVLTSIWVGMLMAAVVTGLVAAVTYYGIIRFVRTRPVTVLILTFLIGFFIIYLIRVLGNSVLDYDPLAIPVPRAIQESFAGLTASTLNNIFIFVSSWLIIGLLMYFVKYTRTGRAIKAVSMSDKGAALVGIDAERINLITWALAGAFAGFAGVLLAFQQGNGSWLMSIQPPAPLILSFSIVILGGLGSIKGSVAGAYIIGFVETFTVNFVPGGGKFAGLSSLVLLLVFLLVKPEGLFGRGATD